MFLAGALTLVTSGTTLLTIPLLMAFGIAPRTAIATSTAMITLMSLGGTLGFLRGGAIDWPRAVRLAVVCAAGSALGVKLVFSIPETLIRLLIPISMILVLIFLGWKWKQQPAPVTAGSRSEAAGYGAALALSVYGGMLRGGYGTLLTALCASAFGLNMLQAVATTRVVNFASSLAAAIVFATQGAIDWPIALWLGGAAMAGALVGARITLLVPERRLKLIFALAVIALAILSLFNMYRS